MTTTPDRPTFEYTVEERAAMLRRMRGASDYFYSMAVRIGVHAFIEFTGLINEFIKLCEEAHTKGIDFTMANVHADQHLPFQPHHIQYLNEKLECIYGMRFTVDNPAARVTPEAAAMADRRPCPFCSEARTELVPVADPRGAVFVVRCLSCAAEGGWAKTEGNAIRHWNMRVLTIDPAAYMTPEHAVTAPSIPPTLLGGKPIAFYSHAYAEAFADGPIVATAVPSVQHAPYCHATIPTPERPDGGCICGATKAQAAAVVEHMERVTADLDQTRRKHRRELDAAANRPIGEPGATPEVCGADDSIPFEYTTIGQKCKNTKPCPVHDDSGNRRRPWNS